MATEVDYTAYRDKAPTKLQARFPDWLISKVGVTFGTKKEEAAFREGVRLATALRMDFQASAENRAATAQERAERAKATTPAPAPEPPAKPVRAAKSTPAAAPAAAAKPATTRGRRGARPAAAVASADAPF